MAHEVEAPCPCCKKSLRFPADWVNKAIRCKNCGTLVRIKPRPSPAAPAEPAAQPAQASHAPTGDSSAPFIAASDCPSPSPGNDVGARQALPGTFADTSPAAPDSAAFALDPGGPIVRPPTHRQRSKGLLSGAFLVGVLLLVALAASMYQVWPQFSNSAAPLPVPPKENPPVKRLPESEVFPRRVLAISVNNYLYANPVSYGSPHHNVHTLVQRIARILRVQPSQIVQLSDTPPPEPPAKPANEKPASSSQRPNRFATATPPLKSVIEKTISAFLETSRPQDHVLVLFIGHIVEIGAEAYLVPLEGELAVKETLIPLSWLYDQVRQCKARQKVLILDTCRFDPSRGQERPGSGPMTAALDGLLQKPPAGVQLWSACTSGQYSYETDGSGVFVDQFHDTLTSSVLKKVPEPQDPLPIETLAQMVKESTAEVVAHVFSSNEAKAVQTPRLTGQMAEQGAPYDRDEPLPREIEIPASSLPAGSLASPSQVQRILHEIDLPPIKLARDLHTPLQMAVLLPFSAPAIERYRPDYDSLGEVEQDSEKYALRVQVIQTVKLLRATFDPKGPQVSLREYFQGASTDQIKAAIFKEQKKPAQVLGELMERIEELRKAGEQRDKEPSPRWQAHYDYILAQLLARTAYVSEYNLMLGKIRKDELPELRPKVHTGWRLASSEKMQSGKDVKDMAAESKKLFAKLIRDHPGSPWAILAKRESLTALGLEWQPSS